MEFPLAIPFYLLAAIAALMMLLLLIGIYETARHIERFDDYRGNERVTLGSRGLEYI
jgi:hypothetical protein